MRSRTAAVLVLVLVVLAAAAYGGALGAPFVFDDFEAIVTNETLRGGLRAALAPPRDTPVAGRPLVNLTFALNHALGGLDPFGYRLANLALHVCAALLVWGALARTRRSHAHDDASSSALVSSSTAWCIAAAWMLHPMQSEAVLYVTQRTEILAGMLYLATLYCAIRALPEHASRSWSLGAVAACALGACAKETLVTAPLAVLAYDRVFAPEAMRSRRRLALYAGLAASWLLLLALQADDPRARSAGFMLEDSPWRYVVAQPVVIAEYVRTALWPYPLAIDYGSLRDIAWSAALPCAALLAILLLATLIGLVRRRPLSFLGAWFFLTLAPSSSLVPIATEIGAERRMYLALAAPIALLAAALAAATRRARQQREPAGVRADAAGANLPFGRFATLIACAVLVVEIGVTHARSRDYASALALWSSAVAARPGNARAHANLGRALLDAGDTDAARHELEAALEIDPSSAVAHYNLGVLGLERAKLERAKEKSDALPVALAHFTKAAELEPSYAAAHNNAGIVLERLGRLDDAVAAFRRGVEAAPDDAGARYNLATALWHAGQDEEAVHEYSALLDAHPAHASAQNNLGVILAQQRNYASAIVHFERALELRPDAPATRANLASALRAMGRTEEANRLLTRAEPSAGKPGSRPPATPARGDRASEPALPPAQ